MKVTCEVSQSSSLVPILFILYINDIVNCAKLLKFISFADDTNIFFSDKNTKLIFDTLNKGLDNLTVWFKINKGCLNVKKTNYIVFGVKSTMNSEFFIDNNVIAKVHSSKYLGIIIDERLKWQEHINAVANKVSKSLGVIYNMKNALPVSILPMLHAYISVLSILQYGMGL